MRTITPSKPDLWHGTPAAGSMWTVEQELEIERSAKTRWPWRGEKYSVTLMTETIDRMSFMPIRKYQDVLCPLLATTRTGRLVITSSGLKAWIDRKAPNE